jgi:preprotein translocase subunit SecG
VLAACFFATSLLLSILAGQHGGAPSILSPAGGGGLAPLQMPAAPAPAAPGAPAQPTAPQAPQSQ